jgi:hypothetical protein
MLQGGQLRESERPEFPLTGPFGGILSEIPDHMIEKFGGFLDAQNISFRKAQAMVRQSHRPLTLMPNPQEPILGIFDFFRSDGNRVQVIVTPTRLFQWNGGGGGSWTQITGALTGASTAIFTASVVAGNLLFCQGTDKVKLWNGVTAGFADAAAGAVPARYLTEVANHLIAAYTIEGGNAAPQRVRWTAANNPTDWTGFNAGQVDLFNDLGPITGAINLYQNGWIFQQWGIVQAQPTGIGTNPFFFTRVVGGRQKGCICPYSIAVFNEQQAPYVGKDNIYSFNGNSVEPIGDFPVSGSRVRLGARSRIFTDLQGAPLNQVFGYATTSIGGTPFNAYWLFIPNVGAWVFNFDEFNWTKFTFDNVIATAGTFNTAGVIRIMDLIGTIQAQSWTPATLGATNPLDDFLIGEAGGSPELSNFSTRSEMPWSLTTGQLVFGDNRHENSVATVRMIIRDNAVGMAFTVTGSNEKGQTQSKDVLIGSGTGRMLELLVTFPMITGKFISLFINGAAGVPLDISEIAPIYTVGNEYATNVF